MMPEEIASATARATTLYSSFSTTAQTLAGILGFLGAFLLFKFSEISRLIESGVEKVRGCIRDGDRPEIHARFFTGDFEGVIRFIETHKLELIPRADTIYLPIARVMIATKHTLFRRLYVALIPTGGAIGLSLLGLCLTEILATSALASWVAMILVLALAITFLVVMFLVFREAVK